MVASSDVVRPVDNLLFSLFFQCPVHRQHPIGTKYLHYHLTHFYDEKNR
ncbi:MAG: hypothetical protein WBA23_21395 [Tunicatimonas sp.]